MKWVDRFIERAHPSLTMAFGRYTGLRNHYLSQGDIDMVQIMEMQIKNHVGIRRLDEDIPRFQEMYSGRVAKFHEGKFLGWSGEVGYDPTLRGVCCYEI